MAVVRANRIKVNCFVLHISCGCFLTPTNNNNILYRYLLLKLYIFFYNLFVSKAISCSVSLDRKSISFSAICDAASNWFVEIDQRWLYCDPQHRKISENNFRQIFTFNLSSKSNCISLAHFINFVVFCLHWKSSTTIIIIETGEMAKVLLFADTICLVNTFTLVIFSAILVYTGVPFKHIW